MNMINTIRTLAVAATVASATLLGAAAASADTIDELPVYISNSSTEFVIDAVYISPVQHPDWGPNLIHDGLFPSEQTEVVPVVDFGNCDFDVMLVFEDGYEMVIPEVDLCENTDIATDGYEYVTYSI